MDASATAGGGGRPMEAAAAAPMLHSRSAGFDLEKLLPLSVAVMHDAACSRRRSAPAEEVTSLPQTSLAHAPSLSHLVCKGTSCIALPAVHS